MAQKLKIYCQHPVAMPTWSEVTLQRLSTNTMHVWIMNQVLHVFPVIFGVISFSSSGHGVFKLSGSDRESLSDGRARIVNDCLEVLQKPSVELMREREMIFQSYLYGRSGDHEEEFVFTDSAYWINTALMNKFRQFYLEVMPDISTVETSIYSDFMTCQVCTHTQLSKLNKTDFTNQQGSDAVAKEQRLLPEKRDPLRRKIAELMCDVPLHILALPDSTFYHIGTMQEYLDVFCTDPDIRDEILSRA